MHDKRRDFIKAGVLGGAAVAAGMVSTSALSAATDVRDKRSTRKKLDLLILGGTGFIGPHMVREALRRGHSVTLFNRGVSDKDLFPDLKAIIGDRNDNLSGLKGGRWDAVIDNSGYVPRHVEASAKLLANNVGHYLYISTISAYASFATPNNEDSPLATIADESIEKVTDETYGPLKALCEKRVRAQIDAKDLTILRPTYVCGPGDSTDRFGYWPVRTGRGGTMLWPGAPSHPVQIIDARDLAIFVVDALEQHTAGTYNMVTPVGSYNFGNLLTDSQAITETTVEPVWVDDAFIEKNDVEAKGGIPIWSPSSGDTQAVAMISDARAVAAGLQTRPVKETIRGVIDWWRTLPVGRTGAMRAGLDPTREAGLIAKAQHSQPG